MLLPRLLVGLLEQVELELRADHRFEACAAGALDLAGEHLPRRGDDGRAVFPAEVAEDERRRLEPGHEPQRRHVRDEVEVAVAALPARHRVSGLRLHLHVHGEQVVAALEAVTNRLLEEVVRLLTLADQPPLHVGEGADDRVDRAAFDQRGELFIASALLLLCRWRGGRRTRPPQPLRPSG